MRPLGAVSSASPIVSTLGPCMRAARSIRGMRAHGVTASASGLVPFAHLAWAYADGAEFHARAREFLADGVAQGQWVEFVADRPETELIEELAVIRGTDATDGRVGVVPVAEFYEFADADDRVVDPAGTLEVRLAVVEKALADGYSGYRAIVDVTPLARTPAQREAMAEQELLVDRSLCSQPLSALCAYDLAALGHSAAELVCLHPFVNAAADGPFQLYADPEAAFALAGELDLSCAPLFTVVLGRALDRVGAPEVVIDGQALTFIDHRSLLELDRRLAGIRATGVLRSPNACVHRVAEIIGLENLEVEVMPCLS